jgi:hypothetical protein
MNAEEGQRTLTAVMILSLGEFENLELASLNNAVQLGGVVAETNHGFEKARKLSLIKENGYPCDTEALRDALAFEVNRRVEAGTFV